MQSACQPPLVVSNRSTGLRRRFQPNRELLLPVLRKRLTSPAFAAGGFFVCFSFFPFQSSDRPSQTRAEQPAMQLPTFGQMPVLRHAELPVLAHVRQSEAVSTLGLLALKLH